MKILVGLGNPGKEYQWTRHNVGFLVMDFLARRHGLTFKKGRGQYVETIFHLNGERIVAAKPLTYMNLSGLAVKEIIRFYKLETLDDLLVVLDDFHLPYGTLRFRKAGSDGGQKGLRSIIEQLNTQEFPRLRIGIGNHVTDPKTYVLQRFSSHELEKLPTILKYAVEGIETFVLEGIDIAMSKFNKNVLEN